MKTAKLTLLFQNSIKLIFKYNLIKNCHVNVSKKELLKVFQPFFQTCFNKSIIRIKIICTYNN